MTTDNSDGETVEVCAEQVWLDGVYRTDCARHIVNGECMTHGKGGPTRPVTVRRADSR